MLLDGCLKNQVNLEGTLTRLRGQEGNKVVDSCDASGAAVRPHGFQNGAAGRATGAATGQYLLYIKGILH